MQFHCGTKGKHLYARRALALTRDQGYELLDGKTLFAQGFEPVVEHLQRRLEGKPVYLCFDMDFFDPSCAPGVCTPTWGGASAREGLDLLHALAGIDFVAFDVNTVSPPHDVGGMTAFLAGTVMLEPGRVGQKWRLGDPQEAGRLRSQRCRDGGRKR